MRSEIVMGFKTNPKLGPFLSQIIPSYPAYLKSVFSYIFKWLTIDGFRLMFGIIRLFDTERDHTSKFTVTHTHTHTIVLVMSSLPLLDSGSHQRFFPHLVSSIISSFKYQLLTETGLQQSFNCSVSGHPIYYRRRRWSHVTTDGRSVSQYVKISSPLWDLWPDITSCPKVVFWNLLSVSVRRPLWREVGSVICYSRSVVIYQYVHQAFTLHVFYSSAIYIQYIKSFIQSRLSTADYALLLIISLNSRRSLNT
jgi:hypothetical protein